MPFTTRLSGGKGGRNALDAELRRLGIAQELQTEPPDDMPEKSSGSTRPSRARSRPEPGSPTRSASSKPSSTSSPSTATTNDRTGRYRIDAPPADAYHWRPKQHPVIAAIGATACDTTPSTRAEGSRCASTARLRYWTPLREVADHNSDDADCSWQSGRFEAVGRIEGWREQSQHQRRRGFIGVTEVSTSSSEPCLATIWLFIGTEGGRTMRCGGAGETARELLARPRGLRVVRHRRIFDFLSEVGSASRQT